MSVTNNLKKQFDTPVWEWTRFAPATVTAISCMACGDLSKDSRYLYYIVSAAFYRYDTWTDTWMQLASPNTTPLVYTAMRYSSFGGFRGRILGIPSSTTLLIPALSGDVLQDETIRIYGGTGANQTKTITNVANPTVFDSGIATATTNANQIQDTVKKWKWNQWAGYQVRVIYGTGATQIRKILYNDANTLYFYDVNYQQIDPWNNQPFSAVAPYAAPVSTAGSQAQYVIEASVITIDSAWNVPPDTASRFTTQSGGIWLISQTGSAPFYTLQYYDIASDIWFTKTAVQGLIPAAPGTDIAMERISNRGGTYISSTGTTGTTRTIVDNNSLASGYTSGSTITDRFVNHQIRIMGGTGLGQRRRIVGNTSTTIYINRKWDILPDNTSRYEIWDDVFALYFGGMAASILYNYHAEADLTCQGSVYDYGLCRNMAVRLNGWEDIGVLTGTRNTTGITAVNTTPVAGGTGHVVGDIVTLGTGTNGKVYIEAITTGGVATLVSLLACGSGYSVATASQSATTGSGTGLQIAITSVGTIGKLATTGINHNIKIGDSVTFTGAVDGTWNTTYTVLGVDSLTSIEFQITAGASAVVSQTTSVSLFVDSAATWDTNEHVGKLIEITVAGQSPTSQIRRITANSGSTISMQSNVTLPVHATSRYIIYDPSMIGRDEQYKYNKTQKGNTGWATSGTTYSITDNSKSWWIDQWAACKVRVVCGTGYDKNELAITGNTTTTLLFGGAGIGFTPDATTKYMILDSFGLCTSTGSGTVLNDTTKKWIVNQWAGKRVKITSGTAVGTEVVIVSNTATQLTAASGMGTPDNTSTYTILGIPARGAGIALLHLYDTSNLDIKGRKLFFPRGGISTTADILDIPNETWEYGNFFSPQSETLTTGSMYTYDGNDIIYFTKDNTGRVYSYNIITNKISNAGTIPYGHGTALIGNRFEVIETSDGLKYLYMLRHSGTEMFRCLIFWQ
jgi:hypothetical protein